MRPAVLLLAAWFAVPAAARIAILTSSPLPAGSLCASYSQQLQASGGIGGYTWVTLDPSGAIVENAMPPGLQLSRSGLISGMPTRAGSYQIAITAIGTVDEPLMSVRAALINEQITKVFSLQITGSPAAITTTTLPNATVGLQYRYQLAATGAGSGTWRLIGRLPDGMVLSPAGVLSGVPIATTSSTSLTYPFTVEVSFGAGGTGCVASRSLSLVVVNEHPLRITWPTGQMPAGSTCAIYNAPAFAAEGGTPPYTWRIMPSATPPYNGTLPPGLGLKANLVSGIPTVAGNYPFAVTVSDTAGATTSVASGISIAAGSSIVITTASLPNGTRGVPYSQQLASNPSGAQWTVTSGALPDGLALSPTGAITGTPVKAGTFSFTVQANPSQAACAATKQMAITIDAPTPRPILPLPDGSLCASYSHALAAEGGTPPYLWRISAAPQPPYTSALPPGLVLSGSVISGTPTAAGTYAFGLTITDSSGVTGTWQASISIRSGPGISITTASPLPAGTVRTPYAQQLTATASVPQWTVTAGTLPPGLSLSLAGAITGTPEREGEYAFTVQASTGQAGCGASKPFTITIYPARTEPPVISTSSPLPDASLCSTYSKPFEARLGTPPYTWMVVSGIVPPGLTLSSAGVLTGTPIASGSASFVVSVRDSSSPPLTSSGTFALVVRGSPVSILTASVLPNGTVGSRYAQQLSASAGDLTVRWNLIAGTLPAGLVLTASGSIEGTPSAAGTFTFTVAAAAGASAEGACAASKQITINVDQPTPDLAVSTASLPEGSLCTRYSYQLTARGGSAPYSWQIVSADASAGISLNETGVLSGVPSKPGTFTFSIAVEDATHKVATKTLNLVVSGEPAAMKTTTLPRGAVGAPYTAQLEAAGTGSPRWTVSGGDVPGGLALSSAGVLSGTPTSAKSYTFTVQVTFGEGGAGCVATTSLSVTIDPQGTVVITTASPMPDGVVGKTYDQKLAASGGTPPYSWSTSNSLPPGLSLNAATGAMAGAPTQAGVFRFTVDVKDSRQNAASKSFAITIASDLTIATASPLPSAAVGVAYSQTITATGGAPPYTWAAGTLPSDLTINSTTGVISGTPQQPGDFNVTVRVTDRLQNTSSKDFTINVRVGLSVTTVSITPGLVGVRYTATLAAAGGTPPYKWSLASGTLPAGISLADATGILSGTPAAAGTAVFGIRVADAAGGAATKTLSLLIGPPAKLAFTGLAESASPAEQPTFGLTLAAPLPVATTGRVTVTFVPNCVRASDDHAIQLSTGTRSIEFTVPANTTGAVFGASQNGQLASTGTTAGTITLTASMQVGGTDATPSPAPIFALRVAQMPPVIANVTVVRNSAGIEVRIKGYSTPRQVTQATFRFSAPDGVILQPGEVTVPLENVFATWYEDRASAAYGSQFLYVQPFAISGEASRISSATVTVSNIAGTSEPMTVRF